MNDLDPKTEARVEVITNALLHLSIRGKELQFAARQIDMALMQAGHLSATVPAGDGRTARNGLPCCKDISNSGRSEADDGCSICASRLSQGTGVRVKALVWRDNSGSRNATSKCADTPFGLYDYSKYGSRWAVYGQGALIAEPEDEAGCIAAAQADYDARIRSALSGDTL